MRETDVSLVQQILIALYSERDFHAMIAIYRILSVLLIFAISLLIVRIGSIALQMTGLSPNVASFQSVSAFSGAGYTTEEAEQTVSTPGRRKR
jgi:Trk-type K+ transport system membrane component